MSEKKKKTLKDVYRAPMPRGVDVQMLPPTDFTRTPPDENPDAGGWLHDSLMRATQAELDQFRPPAPPGFFSPPSAPSTRVEVQMGEPRIVPPVLPPPPEDPLDARAAALERGVRSGGHAMMPALQQMGPAARASTSLPPRQEDLQATDPAFKMYPPPPEAKPRVTSVVQTAAQKQYEFYKQAGLPENEALNRARADALLLKEHLSRSEED